MAGMEESLNFVYQSITASSHKVNALEKEMQRTRYEYEAIKKRIGQLEWEREEGESQQAIVSCILGTRSPSPGQ